MTGFVIDKYDEAKDEHKPKVGAPSPDGKGVITKVQMIEATKLMEMVMKNGKPEEHDDDEVLVVDHPSRPFVKYFVWVKREQGH
jgi:hypothetical protein